MTPPSLAASRRIGTPIVSRDTEEWRRPQAKHSLVFPDLLAIAMIVLTIVATLIGHHYREIADSLRGGCNKIISPRTSPSSAGWCCCSSGTRVAFRWVDGGR
jgi:hypothetical protein